MRNLYDGNIKDVFSIEDLEDLKENGYMNVLAHQDDYIMIETGNDFWKINTQLGEVTQYRDFVSLKNDIGGELVYSKNNPAINKDYGAVLYDTVEASDCKKLPKFSLQDRKDYRKDTTEGLVKQKMKGEFEQSLNINRRKSKEVSSNLTESVNKPETKFISDSIQIASDIMSIIYSFIKNKLDKSRREKFINDVMDKLDKNEMSPSDVKQLMKEYPELDNLLYQWQQGRMRMNVETSTTVDNVLENKQKSPDIQVQEEVKEVVQTQENKENKSLELSEVKEEKEQEIHFDEFLQKTDEEMEQTHGVDFKNKMQQAFKKSGEKDSLEYCFNLLDEKTLDDLKTDNPDINKEDCAKAIAYINHLIDDENRASKGILMDKFSKDSLNGFGITKAVTNIINQMISKGKELIRQQQQQRTQVA